MDIEIIFKSAIQILIHGLEVIGIIIIIISAVQTLCAYIKNGFNPDKHMIKIKFAQNIALALEYKLASEILKTVIVKEVEELYELGAIILIRVILTFVIHWEIASDTKQKNVEGD